MLGSMELREQDRRSWDIPLLLTLLAYSAATTLVVAMPCLTAEHLLETSTGARIAIACWVAFNATLVGVVFWRTRTRRSWFLRAILVALGVWSAGMFTLHTIGVKLYYYIVGSSGMVVHVMFPMNDRAAGGGLPFLPSGPSVLGNEWGIFAATIVASAIFELAFAVLAMLVYFAALAMSVCWLRPGFCENCGYDIRASMQFGRCPECGRSIDMVIHGAAPK